MYSEEEKQRIELDYVVSERRKIHPGSGKAHAVIKSSKGKRSWPSNMEPPKKKRKKRK